MSAADIIEKATRVVRSCKTLEHLECARKYLDLARPHIRGASSLAPWSRLHALYTALELRQTGLLFNQGLSRRFRQAPHHCEVCDAPEDDDSPISDGLCAECRAEDNERRDHERFERGKLM